MLLLVEVSLLLVWAHLTEVDLHVGVLHLLLLSQHLVVLLLGDFDLVTVLVSHLNHLLLPRLQFLLVIVINCQVILIGVLPKIILLLLLILLLLIVVLHLLWLLSLPKLLLLLIRSTFLNRIHLLLIVVLLFFTFHLSVTAIKYKIFEL